MDKTIEELDSDRFELLKAEEISYLINPDNYKTKTDTPLELLTKNKLSSPTLNHTLINIIKELENTIHSLSSNQLKINTSSIKLCSYKDLLNNIKTPSLYSLLKFPDIINPGVICFSQKSISIIITSFLGGTNFDYNDTRQSYSSFETKIIEKLTKKIAQKIDTRVNCISINETKNQTDNLNNSLHPKDKVFLAKIKVSADNSEGLLYIAIPDILITSSKKEVQTYKGELMETATSSQVELTAVLKEMDMELKDILKLEKGDILPLDIAKNDEISIINNNVTLLKGIMGRKGRKIIIKVTNNGINKK